MIQGTNVSLSELLEFANKREIKGEQMLKYGRLVVFEDGTAVAVDGFEIGRPTCTVYKDFAQQMKKYSEMLEQARKIAALNGQPFVEPTEHPCDQSVQ